MPVSHKFSDNASGDDTPHGKVGDCGKERSGKGKWRRQKKEEAEGRKSRGVGWRKSSGMG